MYFILSILVSLFTYSTQETVKVTVFYESLCPASQSFISNQFYPGYLMLGNEALSIELFPFSEVKKINSSNWYVNCQHGDLECFSHKVQVCALNQTNIQEKRVNFVGCLMSTDKPESKKNMRKCARKTKVLWTALKECLNSDEGNTLMAEMFEKIKNLRPKLKYVPHILFNDKFNRTLEKSAKENFLMTVCEMYETEKPVGCPTNPQNVTDAKI